VNRYAQLQSATEGYALGGNCRDNLKSRPNRTLCVILVRKRIAEVNQQSIGHELGDAACMPLNNFSAD
jgi:hypothetical protein